MCISCVAYCTDNYGNRKTISIDSDFGLYSVLGIKCGEEEYTFAIRIYGEDTSERLEAKISKSANIFSEDIVASVGFYTRAISDTQIAISKNKSEKEGIICFKTEHLEMMEKLVSTGYKF